MNEPTPQPHTYDPIVQKSLEKESAFSTPGKTTHATRGPKSHSTWKPAKGLRFRPTNEKVPGRRRKLPRDERSVTYY